MNDAIAQALPGDGILVRDITVSGSLWGSRLVFHAHGPLMNIHSLAGAIGMGLPMAVGTAIANPQRKVVGLVGDGDLSLNGRLATLAQEKANVTLLIMNDGGYGVVPGIQDNILAAASITTSCTRQTLPLLAQAMGLQAWAWIGLRISRR
ncbi:thiamine pyrophosphate-dependent enzyme [Klebsiella pneumoniae]|nr:thiamine pyrophosphate-dependent enzyme [Klebsiella pneumoniae]